MTSLLTVSKVKKPAPGRYIVVLKDDVSLAAHVGSIQARIASTASNITDEFNLINGYAGDFTDDDLNDLRSHTDIASIEEDSVGELCYKLTQTDATWGLGRISSEDQLHGDPKTLTFEYKYEGSGGRGVDVYVLDSGIDTNHPDFEGRASWGMSARPDWQNNDLHGHGTHCAGIVASGPYGVAKASKVIAVKVLADDGEGLASWFIAGAVWVAEEAARTGRPTIISASLCYYNSIAIDKAVRKLYNLGITVFTAAGNFNGNTSHWSPARTEEAVTIAASNIDDEKAWFSNYGAAVNIWAPGVDVTSTWKDGGTCTTYGTSMATPHVAGFAAYLLGLEPSLTPAQIAAMINEKALDGVLSGVPDGTVNKLLSNWTA